MNETIYRCTRYDEALYEFSKIMNKLINISGNVVDSLDRQWPDNTVPVITVDFGSIVV